MYDLMADKWTCFAPRSRFGFADELKVNGEKECPIFLFVGRIRVWVVIQLLCHWPSKWCITQHGQMCSFKGHMTLIKTESDVRKHVQSYIADGEGDGSVFSVTLIGIASIMPKMQHNLQLRINFVLWKYFKTNNKSSENLVVVLRSNHDWSWPLDSLVTRLILYTKSPRMT